MMIGREVSILDPYLCPKVQHFIIMVYTYVLKIKSIVVSIGYRLGLVTK